MIHENWWIWWDLVWLSPLYRFVRNNAVESPSRDLPRNGALSYHEIRTHVGMITVAERTYCSWEKEPSQSSITFIMTGSKWNTVVTPCRQIKNGWLLGSFDFLSKEDKALGCSDANGRKIQILSGRTCESPDSPCRMEKATKKVKNALKMLLEQLRKNQVWSKNWTKTLHMPPLNRRNLAIYLPRDQSRLNRS